MRPPTDVPLLGLLSPPDGHRLVGALFATFSFDGPFFEKQVLPTLFGVPVIGRDVDTYASVLHEGLLEAPVHVWCDATQFHGDRRLFGYDMTLVPPTFHPKVSLLVSQGPGGDVRADVTVASANLTKAGYRTNAEVVVTASSATRQDRHLVRDVIAFLRAINELHPAPSACAAVLDKAEDCVDGNAPPGARRFLGSAREPILRRLLAMLEPDETVLRADVLSPSFERPSDAPEATFLREFVTSVVERSGDEACVFHFGIPAPAGADGGRTAFPFAAIRDELGSGQAGLYGMELVSDKGVRRPVHGKVIALETDRRCLVYCGSANFSAAALRLALPQANWEAGVAMSFESGTADSLWPQDAWVLLAPEDLMYEAPPPDEDSLNGYVAHAAYDWEGCTLSVLLVDTPPESWELEVDGVVLDRAHAEDSCEGALRYLLARLRRPVLTERIDGAERWVPIEITDKAAVPAAPDLPPPPAEEVLAVFAGRRSRTSWDARVHAGEERAGASAERPPFEFLPLFFRALPELVADLEREPTSEWEYQARWRGPWGLSTILDDLAARATAGRDYPEYVLMQTLELRWRLENAELPEVGSKPRRQALERVAAIIKDVGVRVPRAVADVLKRKYTEA